ncbi:MAG: type II toxin-antitoxin system RelE family toxin [Planctomycetaceae bacterium]
MAAYRVVFKSSADKSLRAFPESMQRRIATAAEALGSNPRPRGSLKLKGEDRFWRIRVGNHRIIYTIQDDILTVLVVRVAHRRDAYLG